MTRAKRRPSGVRWLSLAVTALICIPCLLAPFAAGGGAGLLAAVGGLVTRNPPLVAGILAVGGLVAGALYLRPRRHPAVCDLHDAAPGAAASPPGC